MIIELLFLIVVFLVGYAFEVLGRVPGVAEVFQTVETEFNSALDAGLPKVRGFLEIWVESGDLNLMLRAIAALSGLLLLTYFIGFVMRVIEIFR